MWRITQFFDRLAVNHIIRRSQVGKPRGPHAHVGAANVQWGEFVVSVRTREAWLAEILGSDA